MCISRNTKPWVSGISLYFYSLPFFKCIYQSFCLSIHLSVFLSVYLFINLSIFLSVLPSIYMYLYNRLFKCLFYVFILSFIEVLIYALVILGSAYLVIFGVIDSSIRFLSRFFIFHYHINHVSKTYSYLLSFIKNVVYYFDTCMLPLNQLLIRIFISHIYYPPPPPPPPPPPLNPCIVCLSVSIF